MAIDFRIGQTIQGQGDWETNELIRQLAGLQGQKLGDWVVEGDRRYIDTAYGRVYDSLYDYQSRGQGMVPGEGGYQPPRATGGVVSLGRYANEHGSDSLVANIGEDGTLQRVYTDRESNADMNTMLALIATAGIGSYLYGGAAAAGGGELAGATAAGYDTAGLDALIAQQTAAYSGTAATSGGLLGGISAGDALAAGLAVAGITTANRSAPEAVSVEAGEPTIEGPTAPPPVPTIDYQTLAKRYGPQNQAKNLTNLNPAGINVMAASRNTLMGT